MCIFDQVQVQLAVAFWFADSWASEGEGMLNVISRSLGLADARCLSRFADCSNLFFLRASRKNLQHLNFIQYVVKFGRYTALSWPACITSTQFLLSSLSFCHIKQGTMAQLLRLYSVNAKPLILRTHQGIVHNCVTGAVKIGCSSNIIINNYTETK